MEAAIQQKVDVWMNGNFDDDVKSKIRELQASNEDELADAFYKNLEFGTGGLRGIMGIGTNRINKYTIGMATQGYANYLQKSFYGQEVKVAIAHDSRNNSRYFAETHGSSLVWLQGGDTKARDYNKTAVECYARIHPRIFYR